jgi:hypothetical protein
MTNTLTFATAEVAPLVQSTLVATSFRISTDELFDPTMHIGGKLKKVDGWPDQANIDLAKLKPALWLVSDRGVYLMSNAELSPELKIKIEAGQSLPVAYANECNPKSSNDDWYANKRAIMGGDDCVTSLPLAWFEEAVKAGKSTFQLQVTSENIRIIF